MRFAFAAFTALVALTMPALSQPLLSYRWENRPLLVFAPAPDHPAFIEQEKLLRAEMAGLEDRDMAVLLVTAAEGAPEVLAGPTARGLEAGELRESYSVGADGFAVILVGKDGGEKNRWTEPVEPARIFEQIDAMPMRRREMREGG